LGAEPILREREKKKRGGKARMFHAMPSGRNAKKAQQQKQKDKPMSKKKTRRDRRRAKKSREGRKAGKRERQRAPGK